MHIRRLAACASAGASLLLAPALAQQAPDAGRLLQETRPAAPAAPAPAPPRLLDPPVRPTVSMPDGVSVTPSSFRVTGARSFETDALQALLKPWVDRTLDLRGLNEAAGAITRHYQSGGHLLSYAYLPAQRVADGVIEIAVIEGRIDAVQVASAQDVRLRDSVVQAHVAPLVDNAPLLQPAVERRLLLLNDIPGVVARAAFTPGATPGTADIVVSVAEDEPLDVRLDLSNHGSRSTGEWRFGIGLQLRDLFGHGDTTQARLAVSQRGGLLSGTLGFLVPAGGDGWKLGASVSRLKYELGGAFAALGAQGSAEVYAFKANHPIIRSAAGNLVLDWAADYKKLRDDVELTALRRPKRNSVFAGGLSFDRPDDLFGGGHFSGSMMVSAGELRLLSQADRDADSMGLRSDGSWQKMLVSLARRQSLGGPFSAQLRYTGQVARRNLDSSEKLALGGPGGVRAYAPGEAMVDEGGIAVAELRFLQEYAGGNMLLSLFHDYGVGRYSLSPLSADNEVRLRSLGLGLQWSVGDVIVLASVARRGNRKPTAEGGDPGLRAYLQMSYSP